jgi:TetR/AcrR family transcriptional regulator, tetracycline repressor protein
VAGGQGRGARPGRPAAGEPALTRDLVVRTALDVVDRDGVRALTTRRLATELGCYPAAVQHHAGTKDELLTAVSDEVLDGLRLPGPTSDWKNWVRTFAREVRRALHAHPNVAPVMAAQVSVATGDFGLSEAILAALAAGGFEGERLVDAYNAVVGFVFGWVFAELAAEPDPSDTDWSDHLRHALTHVSTERAPTLAGNVDVLSNKAFMLRWQSGRSRPLDRSFDFAVDVLVGGLEAAR